LKKENINLYLEENITLVGTSS